MPGESLFIPLPQLMNKTDSSIFSIIWGEIKWCLPDLEGDLINRPQSPLMSASKIIESPFLILNPRYVGKVEHGLTEITDKKNRIK